MMVQVGYNEIIDLGAQSERFEWLNVGKVFKNGVMYRGKLVESGKFCERRRKAVLVYWRVEFVFGIGRMVFGVGIWIGGDQSCRSPTRGVRWWGKESLLPTNRHCSCLSTDGIDVGWARSPRCGG